MTDSEFFSGLNFKIDFVFISELHLWYEENVRRHITGQKFNCVWLPQPIHGRKKES